MSRWNFPLWMNCKILLMQSPYHCFQSSLKMWPTYIKKAKYNNIHSKKVLICNHPYLSYSSFCASYPLWSFLIQYPRPPPLFCNCIISIHFVSLLYHYSSPKYLTLTPTCFWKCHIHLYIFSSRIQISHSFIFSHKNILSKCCQLS